MADRMMVCETIHAIVTHVRWLGQKGPMYGGGADTDAICGRTVAWDTRIPVNVENVTCRNCRRLLEEMGPRSGP